MPWMRALAIVHHGDAGPGVFANAMRERGIELDEWQIPGGGSPPGDPFGYDAVLTFGGAMHADQEDRHPWLRDQKALLRELLDRGVPLLGVCLGSQLLAEAAGGRAVRASEPEIGWLEIELTQAGADDPLIGPMAPGFVGFQWHSYESELPPGATALAHSPVCLQAYRVGELAWGIQFHAEVALADLESWIDDYMTDDDAVRIGLDPEALRRESRGRIEAWNRVGRALCGRFVELALTPA